MESNGGRGEAATKLCGPLRGQLSPLIPKHRLLFIVVLRLILVLRHTNSVLLAIWAAQSSRRMGVGWLPLSPDHRLEWFIRPFRQGTDCCLLQYWALFWY